ncbi:hypothetical protein [Georgenia satyanarayanai]|nr:hypothetical protein [Georgenia satyanarayanai]
MATDNTLPMVELAMQELESMDAPFWGTAISVVTGVSAVSGVGATIVKTLIGASIIAT